jgi:succinate dehydrogenase hydrophobic anchor subunit
VEAVLHDYVHQPAIKMWSMFAIKGACVVLGLLCIVSVLRIGL